VAFWGRNPSAALQRSATKFLALISTTPAPPGFERGKVSWGGGPFEGERGGGPIGGGGFLGKKPFCSFAEVSDQVLCLGFTGDPPWSSAGLAPAAVGLSAALGLCPRRVGKAIDHKET